MARWLSIDSKFYHGWSIAGDLVLINLLTLLFSIPLITAGAAFTATQRVCQEIVREEESYPVRTWFKTFRENFSQATIIWLPALLLLFGFYLEERFLQGLTSATTQTVLTALVIFGIVIIVSFLSWYFSLLARFENKTEAHVINALRLALGKLPITIASTTFIMLPLTAAIYLPSALNPIGIYFFFIGFSFAAYLQALLQLKTLNALS
ncbi:MAG: YesL family protein [Arcanobacterium sp.]|nr:YesL family protein [Arcanobacterium sp.]